MSEVLGNSTATGKTTIREKVVALRPQVAREPVVIDYDRLAAAVASRLDLTAMAAQINLAPLAASAAAAASASVRGSAIGAMQVILGILALRLLLLLGLIGAFVVSWNALKDVSQPYGVAVLVAYSVFVLMPLVWLERSARPQPPREPAP